MSDATVPRVSEPFVEQAIGPAIGPVIEPVLHSGARHDPFEVVYEREFHAMVRLATALVDADDQAEEVVQEAFAQLYLRYGTVANPGAYARMCVLNGCRKVLRRRRLLRHQPAPTEEHSGLGFNHVLDTVRALPAKQRNAIVLRYELQLSDQEIADTLGMPIGTVKSTLHRALARLRTEVLP
jgi:RNA polymerase sigma factor (sigma-70 family)